MVRALRSQVLAFWTGLCVLRSAADHTCSSSSSEDCDVLSALQVKNNIAYGTKISQGSWERQFDFVAKVQNNKICNGLVWGNKVLTNAGCASSPDRTWTIKTAYGNFNAPRDNYVIHPLFNVEDGYDFALITLNEPVPNHKPLKLNSNFPDVGTRVKTAGMGLTADADDVPGGLPDLPIQTDLLPIVQCPVASYQNYMRCVGAGAENRQGGCGADTGTPWMNFTLDGYAVVSGITVFIYGTPCGGLDNNFGMHLTAKAKPWLQEIAPGSFEWTEES